MAFKTCTLFTSVKNTTQRLDEETLERLRDHGKMGDSFNRVLNRLLDKIDDLENELDDQRDKISDQPENDDDED